MKEKLLGLEHPDVAITLNNLATLLKALGKLDEAAQYYRRALTIFERALSPEHPNLVACRKNYDALRKANSSVRSEAA